MKFRYILTSIVAVLAVAVGCTKTEVAQLKEVQVSSSYIALPVGGGSVDITVNAVTDWEITEIPEWLKVEPAKGPAGQHTVKFSAEATTVSNEAVLKLNCCVATQLLTVIQMADKIELPISTAKEVNAAEDGKMFRVKGTVTSIANTKYGNMYVTDETGSVYVYGTLFEGAEAQFEKLGIEVGDIVTVEGPKSSYNGSPQMVNVTVIELEKSLIKVDSMDPEDGVLPVEGGNLTVNLTLKGDGVRVQIPEDAKSWIEISAINVSTKDASVTFNVKENQKGDRTADITIFTTKNEKEYSAIATVKQNGNMPENATSIVDAVKTEEWIAVEGTVTASACSKGFVITDKTASLFIYTNEKHEYKNGDIVKVAGKMGSYNKGFQIGSPIFAESKAETVAESSAKVVDGAAIDEIVARQDNFTAERITVTGTASLDNYKNLVIAVDGTAAIVKSYYSTMDFSELEGKNVTATGYVTSRKTAKADSNQPAEVVLLVQDVKAI